jgi:nucleoside-diphosphate-sugar epimerase
VLIAALAERIAKPIGRTDLVRLGARASATNEPAILVRDVRRLYDEVGSKPGVTLEEGVADTISWWRGALEHGIPLNCLRG